MPMLNIYVSDETLAQLNYHALRDGQQRSPVELAEDCVADAAIRGLPMGWRREPPFAPEQSGDPLRKDEG